MKNINWTKVGLYAALGFLTFMIGSSGITKLISMEDWVIEFRDVYGYPLWFMYFIGVVQVVQTVMLWIPKTRFWGNLSIIVIMIGAAGTHMMVGEYLEILQNLIIIALSAAVMWRDREVVSGLIGKPAPVP